MASSKKLPSSDLVQHVEEFLKQFIIPNRELTVGLSGGLDSVVLLEILSRLRQPLQFTLSAIHVNHQLSANAAAWAEFCIQLCRSMDIPCKVVAVAVSDRKKLGTEAAARQARYQTYAALTTDYIVLGHHLDDQIETLMIQLLRGAGPKGLSAMPQARDKIFGDAGNSTSCVLLRPLIDIPRSHILKYARERKLVWIEDESNLSEAFDRNFLRHRVLPILAERFPGYQKTLPRAVKHFAQAAALSDELAQIDMAAAHTPEGISLSRIKTLSAARAKNLLRYYLDGLSLPMPSTVQLDNIWRQLSDAKADRNVCINMGAYEIRRFRDTVSVQPLLHPPSEKLHWTWHDEEQLCLKELGGTLHFAKSTGQGINLEKLRSAVTTVRMRVGGERFKPNCKRRTRSLKVLFQEHSIPIWERARIPLIYSGERLVCVPGIGVDCDYQAKQGDPGVVVNWQNAGALTPSQC